MAASRGYGDRASNVKYTDLADGSQLREFDSGAAYAVLPQEGGGNRRVWVRGTPEPIPAGFTSAVVDDADDILSRFGAAARAPGGQAPPPPPQPTYGGGMGSSGGSSMPSFNPAPSEGFRSVIGNVDFTNPFDSRFQNVGFVDPFDSRYQPVTFGGGSQGVDFNTMGQSMPTLDWQPQQRQMADQWIQQSAPQGNNKGGMPPAQQGGGKGGKGGPVAQPMPYGGPIGQLQG